MTRAKEQQAVALNDIRVRANEVPQEMFWIEPATPAGRVSMGLSVNL